MTAAVVTPGKGTLFNATIATVLTPLASVVSVSISGWGMGTVSTVHLGSAANTYRSTIPEGGEFSLQILYDPSHATHAFLTTQMTAGGEVDYTVTLADTGAAVFAFTGIITGCDFGGMEVEGNVTADVKFKVTGVPVITP